MNEDDIRAMMAVGSNTGPRQAFRQDRIRVPGTNDYLPSGLEEAERVRKITAKGNMSQWGDIDHPASIAAFMMGGALGSGALGSMGTGTGGTGFLSKLFRGGGGGNIWQSMGKKAAMTGMQNLLQPNQQAQTQMDSLLPPIKFERMEDINKILESMKIRGTLNA